MSASRRPLPRITRPKSSPLECVQLALDLAPDRQNYGSFARLAGLAGLAAAEIETSLAQDLSESLHEVFDDTCGKALPIYFGPLLGRLFLEGL